MVLWCYTSKIVLYALGCYTYVCTCHAKPGGYYARVVIPIGFCIQIHRNHLGEKATVPSPKRNRPGHAYSYIIYLQTRLTEYNWPMFVPLIIIFRNLTDFPISGTFPISRIPSIFRYREIGNKLAEWCACIPSAMPAIPAMRGENGALAHCPSY